MVKKLVLVETISMFRMRYVMEVQDDINHASDEFVCNDKLVELSQKHLDDTIVSLREIDQDEYLRIFDEDNNYLSDFTIEEKLDYINKIDYTTPYMGLSSADRDWEYDGHGNQVYKGTMKLYP